MKLNAAFVGMVLLTAGCDQKGLPNTNLTPSHFVVAADTTISGRASALGEAPLRGVNSCPDAQPEIPTFDLNNEGRVDFYWTLSPQVELVQVTLKRMDTTNVLVDGGGWTDSSASGHHELTLQTQGVYYGQMRTRSCSSRWSPWSETFVFSTDTGSQRGKTPPTPSVCVPQRGYEFCSDGRKGGE